MSPSSVARIVLVVLLLIEAGVGAYLIRDALGGLDHAVDTVRAVGFAVLVATLALVILIRPNRYSLALAEGLAVIGILVALGITALFFITSLSTLDGRRSDPSGTPLFALVAVGPQVIIWYCAWRTMPEPLGEALARSMAGAAGVFIGGMVSLFVVGVVASFFMP
jgi:hypothetical protein